MDNLEILIEKKINPREKKDLCNLSHVFFFFFYDELFEINNGETFFF